MMGLETQPDLLEVVGALSPPRTFAGRLDGRQQQADEDADDGNHDQQFDQREANISPAAARIIQVSHVRNLG